ncbi:MAG: glutathione S-transferase [Rhizobiales bacterium]|nr:glutathione S-transferase [Hyphomicrobiales bacterium]
MTTDSNPIKLQGVPGSPYTRKMLAVLRYRRIPYRFIIGQPGLPIEWGYPDGASLPMPKVPLLPTFYFKDENGVEQAVTDSTPIIRRLESEVSGRSIIPGDPVLAFLNYILEDYGDEWLTRCMFHFRWAFPADVAKAATILPFYQAMNLSDEFSETMQKVISERQIGRLYVVGSNETTRSVIEQSYVRFLENMDRHLHHHQFLLGQRPASADFAAVGQLTCLTHFDPTPTDITIKTSPRTYAWVERNEDLCGIEVTDADWIASDDIPDTLIALLREVARTHMPQMLANAKAVASGKDQFETVIDGKQWKQPSFPYQAKCLRWTREAYASLNEKDRTKALAILEKAGLGDLVTATV